MAKHLAENTYLKLIQTLKKQLQEGLAKAELAVMRQRVITYWHMGRHIDAYLKTQKGYEQPHLEKIGQDLGHSRDVLRSIVKFYRCYPKIPQVPKLSWAQYKALLTVPEDQRARMEKLAISQGLGSDRIYAAVSEYRRLLKGTTVNLESLSFKNNQLNTKRGRLYHYKTLQSEHLRLDKGTIMVDIGFHAKTKVVTNKNSRITGGNIIRSVKTIKGYMLKHAVSDNARLYTYCAKVQRVIDADTVNVTVDCGFNFWMDVTVRLFGINAPEKRTAAGGAAYQYVAKRLKPGKNIVIKTYKTEKYGRYLGDIYYLPKSADPEDIASKGIYLNQQLLDERMAVIYRA